MVDCPLCVAKSEYVLWSNKRLRVIVVEDDVNVPAFCRVIWQEHIAEMTDLSVSERQELMNVVWQVEAAMRVVLNPDKINLASLGNVVPHLHWHVIARFYDDAYFPAPIWAMPQRVATIRLPENWQEAIADYLAQHLPLDSEY